MGGLDPKDGANASGLHGSIRETSDVFKIAWALGDDGAVHAVMLEVIMAADIWTRQEYPMFRMAVELMSVTPTPAPLARCQVGFAVSSRSCINVAQPWGATA